MIPSSRSLVTLQPARQAALQAIMAVENARQRGARLSAAPHVRTFLRLLAGEDVAHSGLWKLGARVVPGHFAQTHAHPELQGRTLLDILWKEHAQDRGPAMSRLRRYELTQQAEQCFERLSGGQQARFQILLLELEGVTALLLDEPTNHLDINTIRWLEGVLNGYESTMIIISHDRHFLNEVCTHMADVDYNSITIYPGNYDDYMLASAQSRERAMKDNAKAKERLQELQEFVARFSANKSKARQATSRLKQADKIKSEMVEVKPSTRQNPYIRFEADEKSKLHRQAVEAAGVAKRFDVPLFKNLNFMLDAGERLAIIGPNGAGKSTLLKAVMGLLKADTGKVVWQDLQRKDIAYLPQQSEIDRSQPMTVFELAALGLWYEIGFFGRVNAAQRRRVSEALARVEMADFAARPIAHLSNGQFQRVLFARMLVQNARLLLLDEPFNAVDAKTTYALLEVLRQCHQEGRGVIAVLHDYEQVRAYFPHTLLLAREKIAAGATEKVLVDEALLRANAAMQQHDSGDWCAA